MYTFTIIQLLATSLAVTPATTAAAQPAGPVPAGQLTAPPDRFVPLPLEGQRLRGFLAARMEVNLVGRLLRVDREALLGPFRDPSESEGWSGEHIGKFLDAAAQAFLHTRDARLRKLMDDMAAELVGYQATDGYLGTYAPERRWTDWDLWTHKYNLLGLLAHHRATGSAGSLTAARKIGELLVATFGDGPGQRYLRRAGGHEGMVATSVLEPIVLLYRATREPRFLAFARHVVDVLERPDAARLLSSLSANPDVSRTANAKAYEMLSNFVGLVELYRETGEARLLSPVLAAWQDIVDRRSFATGTVSNGEYFRGDHDLKATVADRVGEGCATVTWLQLNLLLLRVLGEPRFAAELERTGYNALLGAQHPSEGDICYFTPLIGRKPYDRGVTCCGSSEPRGISLLPMVVWGTLGDGVVLWQYEAGRGTFALPSAAGGRGARTVTLDVATGYPRDGRITLTVTQRTPGSFPLHLRVPPWSHGFTATVAGTRVTAAAGSLLRVERRWGTREVVHIELPPEVRVLPGGPSYPDHVALARGPLLLSLDRDDNPDLRHLHLAAPDLPADGPPALPPDPARPGRYRVEGLVAGTAGGAQRALLPRALLLRPFAETAHGRVWLPRPERLPAGPVPATAFAEQALSGFPHVFGSITDGDPATFTHTRDAQAGQPRDEAHFCAVLLDAPATVRRIVYRHGRSGPTGGWFDTRAGKPAIEFLEPGALDATEARKRVGELPWRPLVPLASYPDTRGKRRGEDAPRLADGQPFEAALTTPVTLSALRIVGRAPEGGYVTCAELEAYE